MCAATAESGSAAVGPQTRSQQAPEPQPKAQRHDSLYVCVFCESEFRSRDAYERHESGGCPKA
jgi:hypothetical protein